MQYDILFLEDNPDVHEFGLALFPYYNLSAIDFFSGVKALEYLQKEDPHIPLAYLCDMRIVGGEEELDSSLGIYRFLQERQKVDLFRFFTGHVSEHDRNVLGLTGASVIVKPDIAGLYAFLEEVRTKRDALGKARRVGLI